MMVLILQHPEACTKSNIGMPGMIGTQKRLGSVIDRLADQTAR
jgi:hypothetical protein